MKRVIRVVESKRYRHLISNRFASIYGSAPWTNPSDKENWVLESNGYTWEAYDGTIGLGRVPAKTYEEAVEIMNKINAMP